jgi:L-cystine uptake protein TcyP (sodium:dicarboxylate symporter family)
MQRILTGSLLIITLAAGAALNVNQTWRYRMLESELQAAEKEQLLTYEQNKRLLGTITQLEAPERLLSLIEAHPEWQLKKLEPQDLILITMEQE